MQLVPEQDPGEIFALYSNFVRELVPRGFQTAIRCLGTAHPIVLPTKNVFIQLARRVLQQAFDKQPVFIRSGGSIPIVADFQSFLRIPSLLMGFGLPDDNPHAPNDKFHIPNFYRGISAVIHFLEEAGRLDNPG